MPRPRVANRYRRETSFLLLVALAVAAGLVVAGGAWAFPQSTRSLAAVAIGGGALFVALASLVGTNAHLLESDNDVASWVNAHSTSFSTHAIRAVTQLGTIYTVVALAIVLVIVERSAWVVAFFVAVIGGEEILANTAKALADRVRPAFNPAAASLGPSFPSGHSANAAAFYAAAAFVIASRRGRTARAVLSGVAAAIAVAVAASRVLLDVHWLTDAIAGLALGWTWFAVCTIALRVRRTRVTAAG
jgi:membrane-associated phospholipid phosphatase